jgi:hypothetical protein
MDTLTYRPGDAFLSSNSQRGPWTVVFEDEGVAAYCYACDRSHETQEAAIMDAMLVYNVSALEDRERERLAAVQWSGDGWRAVLYLDGVAQALIDFQIRQSFCRTNFPNFMEDAGSRWRTASHAWDPARLEQFEAEIYGGKPA